MKPNTFYRGVSSKLRQSALVSKLLLTWTMTAPTLIPLPFPTWSESPQEAFTFDVYLG